MKILVVGLNHKSAPVAVREKLAFDSEELTAALGKLKDKFEQAEFVLLSTCNRVELYCACQSSDLAMSKRLAEFLAQFNKVDLADFEDFLYVYEDADAVSHLLMVASSIDSMVVGEAEILGQVKENYRLACAAKSTGKILNHLFHRAFATGKKIHTTTAISSGRVSVPGVAVALAMQLFADICSAKIVVIGAGQMGELLIQHLCHEGCRDITIVNRSHERALEISERYAIAACRWEQLVEQLADANIAIASATAQDYLFTKQDFENRREGTLLIIDIAVPRNFDPAVNEIEDVYLYSIDELSEVAEQNRRAREEDISTGMHIIYEEAGRFMDWFKARDIGPLIGQMKEKFQQISQDELMRFFVGKRQDASCRDVMEPMVHRIVNRLLHCVIENINVVAKKQGPAEAAKLIESIVKQAEEIASSPEDKELHQQ
jgi:glutamyl-tRNA reductase